MLCRAPVGTISLPKMKYNVKPAPMMAAFSSRGPSPISKEILKVNNYYHFNKLT